MKNHYISILSGLRYSLPEDMTNHLDIYQVRLTEPAKGCKKCYKRGHKGFDNKLKIYLLCDCVRKITHPNQKEIMVETPRQTNDIEFLPLT